MFYKALPVPTGVGKKALMPSDFFINFFGKYVNFINFEPGAQFTSSQMPIELS